MSFTRIYVRFERAIAFLILLGMVVVIGLTLYAFALRLWQVTGTLPTDMTYTVFQSLFDRVLATIIALEIAHSIREMVSGRHARAQLRTVIVIGMLAVVRKLVVLDVENTSGLFLAGLAAVILALGMTFALVTAFGAQSEPPAAPGAADD
jgi:uncharacterized membrane protein (DUF373 family)